jgi:CHAT domain-containing protein
LQEPPADPKRIWWCVTGPLAFLPIHAAGIYSGPGTGFGSKLSDFAISSYTPTIRVLFDRVKTRPVLTDNKKLGLLMISQPNTPGLSSIPKTTEEVKVIQTLTKKCIPRVCCLEGRAATVDRTSIEMKAYSSVHFACHASQNTAQPLKSGFSLHDGRLELSSIIQKRLLGVDLAFLSACQTSTGDEKLSEEAVHLAAGMLAAGYRGVVATMWSIKDRYAPEFAEDFYKNLIEGESFSGEHAAQAIHHAAQNLRQKLALEKSDLERSLLVWVPYVSLS